MALPLVGDRVKETTQTSGTGTLTLAGAPTGFRSFAQEFTTGSSVYYLIVDDPTTVTQYEIGIGTFTAGIPNTLSRDTVLKSTNAGNAVSWDNSTKTVMCCETAHLLNSIPTVGAAGTRNLGADIVDDGSGNLTASLRVLSKSANYTLAAADRNKLIDYTAGGVTLTVPTGATLGAGYSVPVILRASATGSLTISSDSTFTGAASGTSFKLSPGDSCRITSDGTNLEVSELVRAGSILTTEATIASATTTDLGTVASNVVAISGAVVITSFGSSANTQRPLYFLRFTGAATLTYNATSLILPGATNIVTAAGDSCVALYLGSGNWFVVSYTRANGAALVSVASGRLIAVQVFTASGTYTPTAGMANCEVTVAGGTGGIGSPGTSGGNSSLGALISANGGAGGTNSGTPGAGGTGGTGGNIRIPGQRGNTVSVGGITGFGLGIGASGSGTNGGGGGGEAAQGWFSAATIGASQVVTIGAAGTGNYNGMAGIIIIREFS